MGAGRVSKRATTQELWRLIKGERPSAKKLACWMQRKARRSPRLCRIWKKVGRVVLPMVRATAKVRARRTAKVRVTAKVRMRNTGVEGDTMAMARVMAKVTNETRRVVRGANGLRCTVGGPILWLSGGPTACV